MRKRREPPAAMATPTKPYSPKQLVDLVRQFLAKA